MTSLQGRKILITRDASQAGSLKEKLADLGGDVICVPTIAITEPPDWAPFDKASTRLPEFDWVVFSSVNAVSRTADRLSHLRIASDVLNSSRLAAVGNQTAVAAAAYGWQIEVVPDRFQAEDLLERLLKTDVSGKNIWIPRALEARPFLVDELRRARAEVLETPVYQNTIPYENRVRLRDVLLNGKIDWITFTSSSTVTNFLKILGDHVSLKQLPRLASIGRITTQTLEKYGLIPDFTADPQNLDGICQGLLDSESQPSQPQ